MISISHIDTAQYEIVYSMTEFNTAIVGIITGVSFLINYPVVAN